MKRFVSLLLSILIIFSVYPMTTEASGIQSDHTEMTAEAFAMTTGSTQMVDQALKLESKLPKYDWGNLQPAKLSGVTCELADNVVKVDPDVTSSISRTGFLNSNKLKSSTGLSRIKPGTTFVDLKNNVAFKIPTLPSQAKDQTKDYVPVVKPEFRDVIKELKIPKQKVYLNKANISNFANSTDKYMKKPGQTYVMSQNTSMEPIGPTHLKDPIAEFYFPKDTTVTGTTPSGGQVSVMVNGYLGFGDMSLDGDYDWDGYEFYFSVAEEIQLQVTVAATLKEEIRIPILGVDIGFGSEVGSIAGGLFLVVGIDGKFTLEMEARQWMTISKIGLKGKNFFGIPYTIRPLFELGDTGFNLDSKFNGAVNGNIKGGALLEINLFGLDLVGAGVFAGMGASSVVAGDYVETDLYGLIQAYVKFIGKHKNIVNWQPNIMHKKQMNTAGYKISFKEACAYRDEVWGFLEYDYGVNGGYKPEPEKDFVLLVDVKGKIKEYPGKTDKNGNFHLSKVDMHKNDKVYMRLKVKDSENKSSDSEDDKNYVKSEAITPTFPFDKVILVESDFFNDYVKGYVPTVIVKDWSTGQQKELKFELNKGPASSLKVGLSYLKKKCPVTLDKKGDFILTSENILPKEKATCQLTYDGFVVNSNTITPTVAFQALSNRIPVSYTKAIEKGKPVDVTKVSETISIMNMRGIKQYVGTATHIVSGYTQASTLCFITNPDTGLPLIKSFGLPDQKATVKFSGISNLAEKEYGTSHFTNTIIKKWFWEPKPAQTKPGITTIRPSITRTIPSIQPPVNTTVPKDTDTTKQTGLSTSVLPTNDGMFKKLLSLPQHTFTLSFDDQFDKYEDYYDNYSDWVDGTRLLRWNDKIVFNYEGVDIILELKDEYEERKGNSKFETIPADWTAKNIESMLNRYLDKMGGSKVLPMPDEINKTSGMTH